MKKRTELVRQLRPEVAVGKLVSLTCRMIPPVGVDVDVISA